jgi:hypothetical protein
MEMLMTGLLITAAVLTGLVLLAIVIRILKHVIQFITGKKLLDEENNQDDEKDDNDNSLSTISRLNLITMVLNTMRIHSL